MGREKQLLAIVAALSLLILANGEIYIVSVEGEPVVSYSGGIEGLPPTAVDLVDDFDITRCPDRQPLPFPFLFFISSEFIAKCSFTCSESVVSYSLHLEKQHDTLLESLFEAGTYRKLYSYGHLINGFAVHMSPEQVGQRSQLTPARSKQRPIAASAALVWFSGGGPQQRPRGEAR